MPEPSTEDDQPTFDDKPTRVVSRTAPAKPANPSRWVAPVALVIALITVLLLKKTVPAAGGGAH